MEENKHKSWCITVSETDDCPLPSYEQMVQFFEEHASVYVFQKEVGEETHRAHYQCAMKLKLRRRKSTLKNILTTSSMKPHQWQLEPMYGTWEEAYTYCIKSVTAVGAPVTNLPYYAGADVSFLEEIKSRYPWQDYLFNELFNSSVLSLKAPDDRKIYWVYDPLGNSGKSKFTKFMVLRNSMCCKVPFGTSTQLRSAIINAGVKRLYIVDVPRTLGKDDDINSIISVLEDLKNGFVVSSMYGKNAQILMNPPHVVVFSNMPCPVKKMSSDRWISFAIDEHKNPRWSNYAYYPTDYSDS